MNKYFPPPYNLPFLDSAGNITKEWVSWFGEVWGIASPKFGTTAQRPTKGLYPGMPYFDTTLGFVVWVNADGTGWVTSSYGSDKQIIFNSAGHMEGDPALTWDKTQKRIEIDGFIRFTGSLQGSYTTPAGNVIPTKIEIDTFEPVANGSILAFGVDSSAPSSSSCISLFDKRSVSHNPTLSVFNPAESDSIGFSWEGVDNKAYLKTETASIIIKTLTFDIATFTISLTTFICPIICDGYLHIMNTGIYGHYATPVGTYIQTSLNVENYTLGSGGQMIAIGVTSASPSSASVISLFDQRSGTHTPSLCVFTPDETQNGGISWEGSDSRMRVKVSAGSLSLRVGSVDCLTVNGTNTTSDIPFIVNGLATINGNLSAYNLQSTIIPGGTATLNNTIQIRRDIALNWTTVNPILALGEPGYETDTGKLKYGDGFTAWNSLSYFSVSPLTTKGDIYTYDTANNRLGVGANGQFLVADSTQTVGIKWKTFSISDFSAKLASIDALTWAADKIIYITGTATSALLDFKSWARTFISSSTAIAGFNSISPLSAKGDLLTYNGTNNVNLPVGINNLFLSADSTQTSGLIWKVGGITALSGDISASGSGSVTATLPTVNSTAGSYGDSTHVATFTVNGKGLVTASGQTAIGLGAGSPLTTKGDIYVYSTLNARLPVGSDGYVLAADSTQATGLKWIVSSGTLYSSGFNAATIPMTAPTAAASWTTTLINGGTITDSTNALILRQGTSGATSHTKNSLATIAKSGNKTFTVSFDAIFGPMDSSANNTCSAGIFYRDSSSGKMIVFSLWNGSPNYLTVARWSAATTFVSNSYNQPFSYLGQTRLRIRDNGTNFYFEISIDKVTWYTLFQESRTAYVPSGGDQYGIIALPYQGIITAMFYDMTLA